MAPSPFWREVSVSCSRRDAVVRVLEEQLVEVAEAEQQQVVRVALLELPVLQHHGDSWGHGWGRQLGRRSPSRVERGGEAVVGGVERLGQHARVAERPA